MFGRQAAKEPEEGSWIWLPDADRRDNRRVFFRREFVAPADADVFQLQISALPFYHVYLNGEHVGYGPSAATHTKCYVDSYDVTQYLTPGINTLGLVVMDRDHRSWHTHPHPPKIWCRLTAGDENVPVVATGKDWKVHEADCYLKNQPRCHYGMDKMEKVDLNSELSCWNVNGYDDKQWENARVLETYPGGDPRPVLSGIPPFLWAESETFEALHSGTYTDVRASAFYSYDNFQQILPGNYAAEIYACCAEETSVRMDVSSDDPFAVFCNDDPVAFRRETRQLDLYEQPDSPRIGNEVLQSFTIHLKAGWNRFLCFQEVTSEPMGMLLLFPEIPKGSLVFRRQASMESLSGWRICGPLRIPLSFSSPSFSMDDRKDTISLLPLDENLNDISAFLSNCEFTVKREGRITGLHQGEFAVYDLEEFRYGFPILDLDGSAGDIVDITCGLHLSGDAVRSIGPLGRMTDTLILQDGNNSWMRLVPRGARYIMISVRKAAGAVIPVLRFSTASSELGSGSDFACSDEVCNEVWKLSLASLRRCVNQDIIDDPCGRRCQALPEAYVYSRTLHFLFGGARIVHRAIRNFAEAQLENGMIMKIVPSGVYSYSPDAALLWILWLENHWNHTGDRKMLEEMIPHLDRLLNFFRKIPPEGDVLLPSGRAGFCAFLNENRTMRENGVFIPLNALYYRATVAAARLYGALNQDPQAECLRIADRLAEDIRQYAYNPEVGLFADFYDGEHEPEYSFRTNMMVLNAGLVAELSEAKALLDKFCTPELILAEIASPFFSFVLETLSSLGRQDLAFEAIRTGYNFNRDRMQLYENGYNPHIFNICAGDFLIREELGVRASAPGFAQIYFNPACVWLTAARGRIPSGQGRILVDWKAAHHSIQAKIESTASLDVLPLIPPKFGATFDLGNYVNLLDPNS